MALELIDPVSLDPISELSPDGATAARLLNSGTSAAPAALEARERVSAVLRSDTAVAVNGWILAAVTGSSYGLSTRPAVRITNISPLILGEVPPSGYVDLEITIDRPLSSSGEAHEAVIVPSTAAQFAGRPPGLRPGIILPSACVAIQPRATWVDPNVELQVELYTPLGARLRSLSVEVDTDDGDAVALTGADVYGWRIVWDLDADDVLLVKGLGGAVAVIPDAPVGSLRLATGERSTSSTTVTIDAGPYAPGVVDAAGIVAGGSIATRTELQVVASQDGSALTAPFGWAATALAEDVYEVEIHGPGGFDGREITGSVLVPFAAEDLAQATVPARGKLAPIPWIGLVLAGSDVDVEGWDGAAWQNVAVIDETTGDATWDPAGGEVRYSAYRVTVSDGSGMAAGFLQFWG